MSFEDFVKYLKKKKFIKEKEEILKKIREACVHIVRMIKEKGADIV